MVFEFSDYKIDVDVDKTREYYNGAKYISENCACDNCRNFEMAADSLPKEVANFFIDLGVNIKKSPEVYVNDSNSDGSKLLYGGFYHVCGKILSGESAWVTINENHKRWENDKTYRLTGNFEISFQEECDLLNKNFPSPAIQLEISANIPWVLN